MVANAYNVAEYRAAAQRVLPRGIFDYLVGGAEDEVTLAHNRAVFDHWGLMPTWGPIAGPDTTTTVLGRATALPLTLSPTDVPHISDGLSGQLPVLCVGGGCEAK